MEENVNGVNNTPENAEINEEDFVRMPKSSFNERLEQAKRSGRKEADDEWNSKVAKQSNEKAIEKENYKKLWEQASKDLDDERKARKESDTKLFQQNVDFELKRAISKQRLPEFLTSEELEMFVRSKAKIDNWEGKLAVFENNLPRLSKNGDPISIEDYVTEFVSKHPIFQASSQKSGSGSPVGGRTGSTNNSDSGSAYTFMKNPFGQKIQ